MAATRVEGWSGQSDVAQRVGGEKICPLVTSIVITTYAMPGFRATVSNLESLDYRRRAELVW